MSVMKRFLKLRWIIIIVVIAAIGYFIYQRQQTASSAQKSSGYKIERGDLEDVLSLSGKIDAHEHVDLQFQSGGMLSWVGVKEGDYVKKNQGIASLDQRDMKMRLKKYLNTYAKTRVDFDQTKYDNRDVNIGGLSKDLQNKALNVISKAQYDLNNTVLDVELQNLAAQYAYLTTPIDGIVVKVNTPYSGVNILSTQAVFEVINPDTVFFSATADQTDVWRLASGMEGGITLDAYPEATISGMVRQVSFTPKTDESGTVYEVEIAIPGDNNGLKYRMGMTGDISFVLRKMKNVIFVPTRYIKSDANGKYVMVLENGKQERRAVSPGPVFDTNTEITTGLKEGDFVVE